MKLIIVNKEDRQEMSLYYQQNHFAQLTFDNEKYKKLFPMNLDFFDLVFAEKYSDNFTYLINCKKISSTEQIYLSDNKSSLTFFFEKSDNHITLNEIISKIRKQKLIKINEI